MNYSRMARKLRKKISRFSGEVSKGLPKVGERFVREMVYGIQVSQSVVLTKIGRQLEERVSIKKVEECLSRQLQRRGMGEKAQENLLEMASRHIGKETLLIPDLRMLKGQRRFLIRIIGNRNLICAGKEKLAREIAEDCPLLYAETIVRVDDGKEKVYHLEFGYRNVKFPGREETLGLLVVRGFGREPMMLLTTERLRRSRKVLWWLVRAYMRRWAIEETI